MRSCANVRFVYSLEDRVCGMPTDKPESLWARLPVSMQESLKSDTRSPLQQWLKATCYDAASLLRYASTQSAEDAYEIILAAAVASVVDASNDEHPIDLSYAIPLWHSLTEGRVSTGVLIDNPLISTAAHTGSLPLGTSTAHIALGLANGAVLDVTARQRFLEQALDAPSPLHLALLWFCIDLDVQERDQSQSAVHRFLVEWIRAFPADRDLPVFLLRKYLDSARRIGVAGALAPLSDYSAPQISPREAAWAIAWDEAARAGAYNTCGDLALQRARQFRAHQDLHRRWLFIYALHEDRREERRTTTLPVARELLDLMYEVEDPNIPASLCASIAARTNLLKPVLRETLPFLKGPTPPLVGPSLDIATRPQSFGDLQEQGVAGVLLAMRLAHRYPRTYEAANALTIRERKSSSPAPILDDYESNLDFMREIFPTEIEDATAPAESIQQEASMELSDEIAHTGAVSATPPATSDLSSDLPLPVTSQEDSQPAAKAAPTDGDKTIESSSEPTNDDVQESSGKKRMLSTGPFDHTIFATLGTEKFTDETLVASNNDVDPTISDVLLAAFLPDNLRARADQLLAQRIHAKQLQERAFIRAIEDRIALLPHSAWAIAELLAGLDSPQEAKSWMKRSVEHTPPSVVRDERYRRLARHCAQRCHDLTQALQFLEQSLETNPIAIETISLLDTIYTRLARTDALRALYERALEHLPAEHTTELRAQWQARLQEINAKRVRKTEH